MTTNRRLGSLQVLTHLLDALRGALTKEIALAVSDLGDAVDRPQARKVVFLVHPACITATPSRGRGECPAGNASSWLPASGLVLLRAFASLGAREPARHRFARREGDRAAVVRDVQRGAPEQGVPGLPVIYLNLDPAPLEQETEGQAGEPTREPGGEGEGTSVVAHAAEPGHRSDPGAGQRGQVNAVAGVVVEVGEVQQGGLAEVIVG